ncbi:MAG: ion channel [Clostridia bacterium]
MDIDKIVFVITSIVLLITILRYIVNVSKKRNKRKEFRELIIICCVAFLGLFASIYMYVEKGKTTAGMSAALATTILVILLMMHQITKIYKEMYMTKRLRKKELIIKYTYMYLYIVVAYICINLTIYVFNAESFHFMIPESEAYVSVTDTVVTFLYFTISTVTALGYGDIVPITTMAKFAVSFENLTSFISISVLLSLIMVENRKNKVSDMHVEAEEIVKEITKEKV